MAPYNCIDLLSTSEVHTFCVVFLRGFRILLLYILLLILIYSIIVSHKINKNIEIKKKKKKETILPNSISKQALNLQLVA